MEPNTFRMFFISMCLAAIAPALGADSLVHLGLDPAVLSKQATIRRDTYGVPHILAENEPAAAYAYGYASAEDYILSIARLYLQGRSEESRYFGEEFAEDDLINKQLRLYRYAEEGIDQLSPSFRRMLLGYALGYNRYIEQHRATLPEWVKPVSDVDILAYTRMASLKEFCMNLRQVQALRDKDAPKTAQLEIEGIEAAHETGSNMWAIAPSRSASGNAMLMGNPHLRWSGSHIWHELHMTVPGEINFMGAALIGYPGAGIGFNEHLAWSHTVNPHDCDDIYELTLDPDRPGHYLYDGLPLPLEKETISIQVKTENGLKEVSREIYWSHHGPVVHQKEGKAYAFKSPHFKEVRFLEQWYRMSKTTSLEEFRKVLDMQAIPMFNIGYADAKGNSFFLFNGRFPDRPEGHDWSGVVPGDTSATEWLSILPQNRLPQMLNPASGYIHNSNSSPWYTNAQEVIDRHEFPRHLCPLDNSLRSQMSLKMLEEDESITFEELLAYKWDERLLLADRVKEPLILALDGHTVAGVDLSEAAKVLRNWNNTVERDSVGSVLFVQFWEKYKKATENLFEEPWKESKAFSTPHGIGDPEAARTAMAETMKELEAMAGTIAVPWGQVFRVVIGDLDLPIGGLSTEFGVFRVMGYAKADDGRMIAAGGDSYVFAVEFSEPMKTKSILAYSQSEDPKSPHFNDQTAMFANHEWKDTWFYEEDLKEHITRAYHPGE